MKTYNLCILGFGNVGCALVRHLHAKKSELRDKYGIEWRLTGVATRRMGWLADPRGLDSAALLQDQLPTTSATPGNVREWLEAAQADVLFELSSLDPHSGQPALDHIRAALEYGAHAITANKGPVAHAYHELEALAQARGKRFFFEATVMAGAPLFSLFRSSLPAVKLLRFQALFNSTSNVILAEMAEGKSFDEAVQKAQELGIAETDPSMDVDGWDATVKMCIVATTLMGIPMKPGDVQREGIRGLSVAEIQKAHADGSPYKLVGRAEQIDGKVIASVRPERVPSTSPLAQATPASLLVNLEMDMIPGLTINLNIPATGTVGPDVTAYDVLADFIRATKS